MSPPNLLRIAVREAEAAILDPSELPDRNPYPRRKQDWQARKAACLRRGIFVRGTRQKGRLTLVPMALI
jgi:hypothetical protein